MVCFFFLEKELAKSVRVLLLLDVGLSVANQESFLKPLEASLLMPCMCMRAAPYCN